MLIKFLKIGLWLACAVLAIKVLFAISATFGTIVVISFVGAVVWNGLANDGWFGEW